MVPVVWYGFSVPCVMDIISPDDVLSSVASVCLCVTARLQENDFSRKLLKVSIKSIITAQESCRLTL